MNDIPRGTTKINLINSLLTPQHLNAEEDVHLGSLQPHVQFTCTITNSRLDDELSVAVIEFIHTPRWLRHLDLDPYGFPKKTHLGTLWRGVNKAEQDQQGQTEFIRAAIADNLLYAEALAEFADVDVNVQDNRKRTALHWAAVGRLPNIVMLCLSVPDCNVGLKDEDNLTAFDIALQANDDLIPNLFYQNILELDTTEPQASLLRVLTITSEPAGDLPVFPGTAMFEPARDRNEALVAALIERRVDLTVRNTDGDTALHVAASQARNTVIAEMLLEAGSDVDATGSGGATALHNAAQTADSDMVRALLRWKAEPAVTDCDGKTALDRAGDNGQHDIVCVLLDHRTDVEKANPTAQPTQQLAEANQEVDGVIPPQPVTDLDEHVIEVSRMTPDLGPQRAVLDSRKLDTDCNAFDDTTLHRAAIRGDTKTVLELFASRANATRGTWFRYTALHAAAALGNTDIVTALLACGVDINERDRYGKTALHIATAAGHTKTVSALLANGADFERNDFNGRTSLHVAAIYGDTYTLTVLLDGGAQIEATVDRVGTALHLAARRGHTETVRALLVRGANINAARYDGFTALHHTAKNGHTDTATALLAGGARITKDSDGMTALHFAASGGHTEIVRALLVNGAHINSAGSGGETGLHLAVSKGHGRVVNLLLSRGANVEVADTLGQTALYRAVSQNEIQIVEILLEHGATIDPEESMLRIALENSRTEIYDMLFAREAQTPSGPQLHPTLPRNLGLKERFRRKWA